MGLGVCLLYLYICVSVIYGQATLPKCAAVACQIPACVDSYTPEGECCAICPGPGRSCSYLGRTYRDGESFPQDCNTCTCNNGDVGCTKKNCGNQKPGRCPRPEGIGICVDMCTTDDECPRRQKCCSNGCGHTCQRPRKAGKSCVHKGVTYQDGESFKDECNTCNCENGNAGCTLMLCPGNPGQCPKPVGGGICVEMCTSDYSCPTGEKCCSNGCGQACMTPIISGGGRPCVHNGKTYQDGQSFKDDCNTCNCYDGKAGCTAMACPGKPGTCPIPTGAGICIEECTSDYMCPVDQKCCSDGCGKTCMKPDIGGTGRPCVHKGVTYSDGETFKDECNTCNCRNGNAGCTRMACPGRPGTCPVPVGAGMGMCLDECTSDYSCPTGEKCCSNGCGKTCIRPIDVGRPCMHKGVRYQDGENFKDECNTCKCRDGIAGCTRMACRGKSGTCPIIVNGVGIGIGICKDDCTTDYMCPDLEKCCSTGCGKSCMPPLDAGQPCIHKGVSYQDGETFKDDCNTCNCRNGVAGCTKMACTDRPGTCPVPVGVGICLNECTTDDSCPRREKCCGNGCGKICTTPIPIGRPCMHKGVSYPDGETFRDECNTCTCTDGVEDCTRMACPGKAGTCPIILNGVGIGVCKDECTNDYMCLEDEKCCSNGCGKSCMRPLEAGQPCIHKGISYRDGETFKDDCNTCNCRNGRAGCTKMACPGRPGTCPVPVGAGSCWDECTSDDTCPRGEKCCSNGCGKTCIKPIDIGRPCMHNGVRYEDGETFKDECNTCNCRDGVAGCTRMACPGKTGTCPIIQNGIGIAPCKDDCTTDYMCPGVEKCCSAGCGKACMRPLNPGKPCVYNGVTHQDGETFMEDCNTCRCSDGRAACTRMACPKAPCVYNGVSYRHGESFKDECNTCQCNDGNAKCTQKSCPDVKPGRCPDPLTEGICVHRCTTDLSCPGAEKCCSNGCGTTCMIPGNGGRPCYHNGKRFADGETFKDDCNTCTCSDGNAACTLMACPGLTCLYNGMRYQDGESFRKECNTCQCSNGQTICTLMACHEEKPGQCPPTNGTGICVHRCTTDLSCPRDEKCCSNGCGTVCKAPVSGGGTCFHKGNIYNDGESFKDDCNTCTCSNGKLACTLMLCPPDKPGRCPIPTGVAVDCVDNCTADADCNGVEKCCSNGCGKVCMIPDDAGRPCIQNGQTYKHGEQFKDDCNTCTCSDGNAACTLMACPPKTPCYHNGTMHQHGDSFKDDCNTCLCTNGQVSCTYIACGQSCTHQGKTYQDGEAFRDDCNTCQCNNGNIRCTFLNCTGAKPGSCPRPQMFRPCRNRCINDRGCPGNDKCCNNWCGHTCMEPIGGDDCATVICPTLECNAPNTPHTPPGRCCPICRPPIGEKPGSCPRRPGRGPCVDLCTLDFNCPGQQKCCSHRCGKSCKRPRFDDRCSGISCPPLRCLRQFRPPGRCCPICRGRRD